MISAGRDTRAGAVRLKADREAFRPAPAKAQASRSISTAAPGLARGTPLLSLPEAEAAPALSYRQQDVERLTQALAEADNPDEADRLQLRLAAACVGAGDWEQAGAIYRDLAKNANRTDIRQAAQANLEICNVSPPAFVSTCGHAPAPAVCIPTADHGNEPEPNTPNRDESQAL